MPKFYVVWKGRRPGIYRTWADCSAQVNGFVGAQYKAFDSLPVAEEALRHPFADYMGKPAPRQILLATPPYITESWSTDAACSGNPGRLEYRCVHTASGAEIFHHTFQEGTSNIGEFLALVEALELLQQKNSHLPIYTDSHNAVLWVNAKKCRTRQARSPRNAPLFERIAHAVAWLASNTFPNKILKWDTAAWGEIKADFGRK
jgi:ribonuclease HI